MKKISIIGFLEKDGFAQANRVIRGVRANDTFSRLQRRNKGIKEMEKEIKVIGESAMERGVSNSDNNTELLIKSESVTPRTQVQSLF